MSSVPPSVQNEYERLKALQSLNILDTPPESVYDEAAQLAAAICGTPIAIVNLLDKERQWFKASVGMDASEVPREHAFCNHLIGQNFPFVVPDANADARFSVNPFVTCAPHIRFYAGMPINTTEGYTVGALCAIDTVPRELTEEQLRALTVLGRQVAAQMELRAKIQLLGEVLAQKEQVERELRERSALFSAFMENSPNTAFIKDREGRFLYYNRLFCERFAVTPTEWIGKSVSDVFSEEFARPYDQVDQAVLQSSASQIVEEIWPGPGGSTTHWRTHKFRISDDGELGLLGGIALDISAEREAALKLQRSLAELEAANRELTELSVTDGLTGVRNRRAFDDRLARKVADGIPLSLILLDIDHFKRLNDRYGHSAGDDLLREVACLLVQNSRTTDYVARFGGEEFAVILPATGAEQAFKAADHLRACVADFWGKQHAITLSAGVATRTDKLDSAAKLIEAADHALYCAKDQGRNCVVAASDSASPWPPAKHSSRFTISSAGAHPVV